MRHLIHVAASLVVPLALALSILTPVTPATAQGTHWVCPPCGQACDDAVFDRPGTCPKCGMPLVEQKAADAARAARKKVAILVFNGVEIIDYSGPYEVFGTAGFDVYTVGETKDPIVTAMGLTVVPKFSFADAPQPDVLVVPGGGIKAARGSAPTLKWVADVTARAQHTMSVCNGAFILASAGLLDGLTATTTAGNLERLKAEFPKTKVVYDQRFVDNGKIVTTAGLTAGIDGALHVLSKMIGNGTAQQVALVQEYDWRPDSRFARAALADMLIPNVDLDGLGTWDMVRTEGGTDRWEMTLRGAADLSAAQLLDRLGQALIAKGKWTRAAAAPAGTPAQLSSDWTFSGRDGEPWTGRLTIETVDTTLHRYHVMLAIARAGVAGTRRL